MFETMQQVDDYLSGVDNGKKIVCLMCGKAFIALGVHLLRKHGMTSLEYKIEQGIPVTMGAVAPCLSNCISATRKKHYENENVLNRARMQLAVAREQDKKQAVTHAMATKNRLRQQSKKLHDETHLIDRMNNEIVTSTFTCCKCNVSFERATTKAVSLKFNLVCDECRQKTRRKPRKRTQKPRSQWTVEQRLRDNLLHKLAKRKKRAAAKAEKLSNLPE